MTILLETHAVIFDLDGTLVSSSRAHEVAFREVIGERRDIAAWEYSEIAGMRTDEALVSLGIPPKEIPVLVSAKRREYLKAISTGSVSACPGAITLLDTLRHLSYKTALVTSAGAESTSAVLQALQWREHFEVVVTGDDVKYAKPNPAGYLRALQALGVQRSRTVGVEDSSVGIQALISAGISVWNVGDPMLGRPCGTLEELRDAILSEEHLT
jgi:HAD superfamily hydrolase (TIGR01509 family)